MVKFLLGCLLFVSTNVFAADFIIQVQPAPNSVSDGEVSSLSNSKVTGLGTLSTKSTITNSEVADGALSLSKLSGFVSAVASQVSSALSAYLPLSSIPNCANDEYLSNSGSTLSCVKKNKSIHVSNNYTATSDIETIFINTMSGQKVVNLPPAAQNVDKKYVLVLEAGIVNDVIIDPSGSEEICDQQTVKLIGLNDSMTIQSNGTEWVGLNNTCIRTVSGDIGGPATHGGEGGNCPANSTCNIWRQVPKGSLTSASTGNTNILVVFKPNSFSETPICSCGGVTWGASFRACFPMPSVSNVTLVVTSANEGSGLIGAAMFICNGFR